MRIRLCVLGLLFFTTAAEAQFANAACAREEIVVIGAEAEEADACDAVEGVFSYLAAAGIRPPARLVIRFQPNVMLTLEAGGSSPSTLLAVSGYYDARRNEVRITSLESPWTAHRRPWGLPWDRRLGFSILRHEIAHAVIYYALGETSGRLPRAWHEALAYAVQIELMEPDLRAEVLARYPAKEAFGSMLHINDFVYGVDPDAFAISAYKTYVREGRQSFINRALGFQYEMIDLRDLP